jgi:predicted metal-binding membrane protein
MPRPLALMLVLIAVLAWGYLIHEHRLMSAPTMSQMWMPPSGVWAWAWFDFWMTFVMWTVMMAAMMAPAALPLVPMLARAYRPRHSVAECQILASLFLATYLGLWILFGAAMTLLQWQLHAWSILTPMMEANNHLWAGLVILASGAYQFTLWKHACLSTCRTPLGFVLTDWRDGKVGAVVMAWRYARYCVGCCGMQMVVMFSVGVMNLLWMGIITLSILAEKTLPHPNQVRTITGIGLMGYGIRLLAA